MRVALARRAAWCLDGSVGSLESVASRATQVVDQFGVCVIPGLLEQRCPSALASVSAKLEAQFRPVYGHFASAQKPIGIGSAAGYKELVQRSTGRFDVPAESSCFTAEELSVFEQLAAAMFGRGGYEPVFCGMVKALPKSPAQEWHIDSPHEAEEHQPALLCNMLVALHDVPLESGPTEFVPGSHFQTNHFTNPRVDLAKIPYQHGCNAPLRTLGPSAQGWRAPLPKGTLVVFDDRILHRGTANLSERERSLGYISYKRRGFEETTHFESAKSLFA